MFEFMAHNGSWSSHYEELVDMYSQHNESSSYIDGFYFEWTIGSVNIMYTTLTEEW